LTDTNSEATVVVSERHRLLASVCGARRCCDEQRVGILRRAAIAALLDGTLGLDRELRRAAAGVRTYGLVGMGVGAGNGVVVV